MPMRYADQYSRMAVEIVEAWSSVLTAYSRSSSSDLPHPSVAPHSGYSSHFNLGLFVARDDFIGRNFGM